MRKQRQGLLRRLFAGALSLMLCASIATAQADELSPDAPNCSLTLEAELDSVPLTGLEYSLYKVAEVKNGKLYMESDFTNAHVAISADEEEGDWYAAAVTLEGYLVQQNAEGSPIDPVATGEIGRMGTLTFYDLEPAVYLLIGQTAIIDEVRFVPLATLVSLPGVEDEGEEVTHVTMSPKIEYHTYPMAISLPLELTAHKVWEDEDNPDSRPKKVEVILYGDGMEYGRAILNEANNWSYTWTDLDPNVRWIMAEDKVPDNYTVTVVGDVGTYVITNTYSPETPEDPNDPSNPEDPENPTPYENPGVLETPTPSEDPNNPDSPSDSETPEESGTPTESDNPNDSDTPGTGTSGGGGSSSSSSGKTTTSSKLPQTGQLRWPEPVLGGCGLMLMLIGLILRREKRDHRVH